MGGVSVRDVDVSRIPESPRSRGASDIEALRKLGFMHNPQWSCFTSISSEVTDTISSQAQKFIVAYSEFLKRQGKLPIPGTFLLHITQPFAKSYASIPPSHSPHALTQFDLYQAGSILSRPPILTNSLLNLSTGSTSVPPASLATSTCARPSASVAYEKPMAARKTAAAGHRTMSTLPGPLTGKYCRRWRRSVLWSKMRRRVGGGSRNRGRGIWIGLR